MTATEEQVASEIKAWIGREFLFMSPEREVLDDENLTSSGIIDSMGVLELILFLEDAFGVAVADHEVTFDNVGTVRNITRFVLRARREAA